MYTGDQIIHLISRLRERMVEQMTEQYRAAGLEDIVPAHGGILYLLGKSGPLPMKAVAEALQRDSSTITTLMNKLIKLGYVKQYKDPDDGRVSLNDLTTKGRDSRKIVIKVSRKLLTKAYGGMGEPDRKQLLRLLLQMHENL